MAGGDLGGEVGDDPGGLATLDAVPLAGRNEGMGGPVMSSLPPLDVHPQPPPPHRGWPTAFSYRGVATFLAHCFEQQTGPITRLGSEDESVTLPITGQSKCCLLDVAPYCCLTLAVTRSFP